MSLLEKAKEIPFTFNERLTAPGEPELVVAWVKGEISSKQFAHAIGGRNPASASSRAGTLLRRVFAQGMLTLELKE